MITVRRATVANAWLAYLYRANAGLDRPLRQMAVPHQTLAHRAEARLPAGKTLATLDFNSVPMVSKAQLMALASGDEWLAEGADILLFGPRHAEGVLSARRGGKSHLSSALRLALIENGRRVLFARTTDLVRRLQIARRELALESAIAKLDRYDLLILDDLAYVTKE